LSPDRFVPAAAVVVLGAAAAETPVFVKLGAIGLAAADPNAYALKLVASITWSHRMQKRTRARAVVLVLIGVINKPCLCRSISKQDLPTPLHVH
jgi:hypothetical protein